MANLDGEYPDFFTTIRHRLYTFTRVVAFVKVQEGVDQWSRTFLAVRTPFGAASIVRTPTKKLKYTCTLYMYMYMYTLLYMYMYAFHHGKNGYAPLYRTSEDTSTILMHIHVHDV